MISGGVWELLVSSVEAGALCLDGTLWDERAELHTRGSRAGNELENESPQGRWNKKFWSNVL